MDITTTTSDFNIMTMFHFIESGAMEIPGFQRHYVWDIKRASRLIESLIIGLPVPQLFLCQEKRNKFLVIDGQQRLMSIYYFVKQRFPRPEKRVELRRIFNEEGKMPDSSLRDDEYFVDFGLSLNGHLSNSRYSSLADEYRMAFDMRPLRSIIIRSKDRGVILDIFERLNSGLSFDSSELKESLSNSLCSHL